MSNPHVSTDKENLLLMLKGADVDVTVTDDSVTIPALSGPVEVTFYFDDAGKLQSVEVGRSDDEDEAFYE